jgi:hypothetical protein
MSFRVFPYLSVPTAYVRELGGLRWAEGCDAIEYAGGHTFALASELVRLLEGFASRRPLMHLGHVLHFMHVLRQDRPGPRHDFTRLNRAWNAARWPARTAGVLAAELCRDVPTVPNAPSGTELSGWLAIRQYQPPDQDYHTAPPLSAEVFEAHLAASLARYTPEQLVHWFRHGEPPVDDQAGRLASEITQRKPPSLSDVLAEVSRHERLRQAVPHVARLEGALSLPPRRLQSPRLQQGGYSDITAKGHPEQLLPSQFALDDLEFLRRWADNELLYFRREEPHRPVAEEVVLLLDQGVRTWGTVRVLLSAATFALAKQAGARKVAVKLAATSREGPPLCPVDTVPEDVASLLSASDLTQHPGLALESALESVKGRAADVVLLTHPRALAEPDVKAAARVARFPARLFAVTCDDTGEVCFHQFHHGSPVLLGRFRLDLAVPPPQRERTPEWTGQVEKVGFPFRFGVLGPAESVRFALDHDGEWLLLSCGPGLLYLTRLGTDEWEMLPRAYVNSAVSQIIGVAGGFVVESEGRLAHYDLTTREAAYVLQGTTLTRKQFRYRRDEHALLSRHERQYEAVSLATGLRLEFPDSWKWGDAPQGLGTTTQSWGEADEDGWIENHVGLRYDTGELVLYDRAGQRGAVVRPTDGVHSAVRGGLLAVRAAGGTLAALFANVRPANAPGIGLFDLLGLRVISWHQIARKYSEFALSGNGQVLAYSAGPNGLPKVVRVHEGEVSLPAQVGGTHNNLHFTLGGDWLAMWIGGHVHIARWDRGALEVVSERGDADAMLSRVLGLKAARQAGQDRSRWPAWLRPDPSRWRAVAYGRLVGLLDYFGQVFLFTQEGKQVAAFFAYKSQFAARLPNGTGIGPERVLGGPPSPDGAARIGQALRDATKTERLTT